jgi:N-acetylneuraminic acid mutarotase
VGDALYVIGGFNYSEPLTCRSTYRLRQESGEWVWTRLECDLPWPVCEASAAVIGRRIYLVGAADYFKATGDKQPDFHTESGRLNSPVGRALLVLDTEDIQAGWRRLADLPGTPRFDCGCAAARGNLYVLGGIYAPTPKTGPDSYYNVVDSWAYNPATDRWSRVCDMPDGANRRAVVFKDRYVILLSGYKYPRTWRLDGTPRDIYTVDERKRPWQSFFEKTVLVYDTKTDELGSADPLLDQTSWPGAAIAGNTIFCLGGEGGARLWHPATFQIGKVEELRP